MSPNPNRRVLLVDDTPSIHEDFRKILTSGGGQSAGALADAKAAFFGDAGPAAEAESAFELDSAYQGQEGLEKVLAAHEEGRPYAMAFVDVRMPPGWDGIQTIKQLWKVDADLQVVICTAYSDYSWEQTIAELGQSDRLLILKKPFDSVEIRQLAAALTEKWNATRREHRLFEELRSAEAEARAYASSLEMMNRALSTAQATSERASEIKSDFLVNLSEQVNENLTAILSRLAQGGSLPGLEEVLESSRSLVRTLDRILDLDRLDSGTVAIEPECCNLLEVVERCLATHRSVAEGRGTTLHLDLRGPVPEQVECDWRRVAEVLDALLENAIEACEQGEVHVTMALEPASDWQHSRLRLTVRDTGGGVPSELQGRLYEPFVRHGKDGAGLGLAITRSLARLMGGDVGHEPGPDGGTVFQVELEVGNVSGARMIR